MLGGGKDSKSGDALRPGGAEGSWGRVKMSGGAVGKVGSRF